MQDLILGYDSNLGLPQEFTQKTNIKTKSYEDLRLLLEDFEENQLGFVFIPAGTLPYIRGNYHILAQATLGSERQNRLTSKLVINKNCASFNPATAKLGRVNPYCTTSFWAPLIYFMQQSEPKETLHFVDTQGFQDMLNKVADQTLEAAMVWDVILADNPGAAEKVNILGELNTLPAPVVISHLDVIDNFKNPFTSLVFQDKKSFFNGFGMADRHSLDYFLSQIKEVVHYFKLK